MMITPSPRACIPLCQTSAFPPAPPCRWCCTSPAGHCSANKPCQIAMTELWRQAVHRLTRRLLWGPHLPHVAVLLLPRLGPGLDCLGCHARVIDSRRVADVSRDGPICQLQSVQQSRHAVFWEVQGFCNLCCLHLLSGGKDGTCTRDDGSKQQHPDVLAHRVGDGLGARHSAVGLLPSRSEGLCRDVS